MSPTQFHQPKSPIETRLALEVLRLKEAAKAVPHGQEREALIGKAREPSHIKEWLYSLRTPAALIQGEHHAPGNSIARRPSSTAARPKL